MMIIVCKIVKYGTKMEIKNLTTTTSFMMISPKLHAIWPVFFLNLSQNLIVILLMYLGTLGDG